MDKETVRLAIRQAFENEKRNGRLGPGDLQARDDRFRYQVPPDTAENWWDFSDSFKKNLSKNLAHANNKSMPFLLPAAMMATLDGVDNNEGSFVYYTLCLHHPEKRNPGYGSTDYIDYLRDIKPADIAAAFYLTHAQTVAVGLFMEWWLKEKGQYDVFDPRRSDMHTGADLQREIQIYEQQLRIVNDWIKLQK